MPLSETQRRVATVVLSLPEADGFALAGGAALIVHGVIDRVTRDLDCFGPSSEAVDRLATAALRALQGSGYRVDVIQQAPGYAKLQVTDTDDGVTQLDLGFDPAELPAEDSDIGAVRALDDLAVDKLLALFARALPRDFVDVLALLKHFTSDELVAGAAAKDRGFNLDALAEAFGVLPTIRRERFDVSDEDYRRLRETFATWQADLRSLR